MGWETANVHLGSRSRVKELREHFKKLKPGWLLMAARDMADAVAADWRLWAKAVRV
jgi:hypothetical protein